MPPEGRRKILRPKNCKFFSEQKINTAQLYRVGVLPLLGCAKWTSRSLEQPIILLQTANSLRPRLSVTHVCSRNALNLCLHIQFWWLSDHHPANSCLGARLFKFHVTNVKKLKGAQKIWKRFLIRIQSKFVAFFCFGASDFLKCLGAIFIRFWALWDLWTR